MGLPDTWDRVDSRHRALLRRDVRDATACCGSTQTHVGPHLLGHLGHALGVDVRLRPFDRGAYQGPLIEAMALVVPLGCDRVSLAMPGRAWSTADPIVPVDQQGDLRQRVLVETRVDGCVPDAVPALTCLLHPYDLRGDTVSWGPSVTAGPGEGWIPEALVTMMAARADLVSSVDTASLWRQRERLDRLGHGVVLTSLGRDLLGDGAQATRFP